MTNEGRVALTLDLDPSAEPICGLLTAADGEARQFVGWLGLASAIEHLLAPPDQPGVSGKGPPP